MAQKLEIAASFLTFAGSAVLLIDILCIRHRISAESGARKLLRILSERGVGEVLTDKKGNPLSSEKALQLWFAGPTLLWGRVGLLLLTLGFIFDLVAKFCTSG